MKEWADLRASMNKDDVPLLVLSCEKSRIAYLEKTKEKQIGETRWSFNYGADSNDPLDQRYYVGIKIYVEDAGKFIGGQLNASVQKIDGEIVPVKATSLPTSDDLRPRRRYDFAHSSI